MKKLRPLLLLTLLSVFAFEAPVQAATFGPTTSASNISGPNSLDRAWLSKQTPVSSGTGTKLTGLFGFDTGNPSFSGDTCKGLVYADSAGSPAALIAASSGVAIPAGDQTIDFTLSWSVVSGTPYWIGIVCNGANSRISEVSFTGNYVRKEGLTYASPMNPLVSPDATGAITFGIYATYTPSASPAVLSSPTPSGTLGTSTTASVGATTDTSSGTLYCVLSTSNNVSTATAVQVKAGQNSGGTSATFATSASVTTTSPSCSHTGLTASTLYYYAEAQNTTDGDSNVVAGSFTTATSAPSLSGRASLLGVGR